MLAPCASGLPFSSNSSAISRRLVAPGTEVYHLPGYAPGVGMQRITITIDDDLLATVDQLCQERGYNSRSEAVRDIVRDAVLSPRAAETGSGMCSATLSYVYSHGTRDLARRLTDEGHHHGVSVASMHVHLDHDDCLEVAVLRGPADALKSYADAITTQRGVRYGYLHLIPEEGDTQGEHEHEHGIIPSV